MQDSIRWRFREMVRAEMNQDPIQREFFEGESINTRLVRESIQNSLDAGIARTATRYSDDNVPVRVRFSLEGIHNPLPECRAERYFPGLASHIDALPEPDSEIGRLAAQGSLTRGDVPFLVVEDAGTVGLEGDWEQDKDSENQPADNNHFYWFFRNVGRSGKGETENGSWGLGKWVFPDASRASAYFAVTRRQSDDETLLMGQSVLMQHEIDGRHYVPYGYFAEFADDGFQMPFRVGESTHGSLVAQCIRDFGLRYRDRPGLSIIIPFPRIFGEEAYIETPKMIAAIVHNYFYPIIAGKLEVTLEEGDDSDPVQITADTIDDVLEMADLEEAGERSPEAYRSLFDMTRRCLQLPEGDHIVMAAKELAQVGSDDYPGASRLRRRYSAYELLAFRIDTDVQKKNRAREKTGFSLYVQRDDSLTEGHDYYVRGTLSISEMDYLGSIRARTLLVVNENEQLAAMLRDSEPPAHTIWRPQTARVTEHWVAGKRRIEEVRYAPRTLLRALAAPKTGVQKDAFADIFPRTRPESVPSTNPRGGTRSKRREPNLRLPSKPSAFALVQSQTGFRVRFPDSAELPPEYVKLRVAYDVPAGNPLKRYQPTDFRLRGAGALDVRIEGGTLESERRDGETPYNELYVAISDPPNFSVTVQGFDPNRDVYVRIDEVATSEDEEE